MRELVIHPLPNGASETCGLVSGFSELRGSWPFPESEPRLSSPYGQLVLCHCERIGVIPADGIENLQALMPDYDVSEKDGRITVSWPKKEGSDGQAAR
jgi:hypothetical protein